MSSHRLDRDERGIGLGIVAFFAMIVIAALLFILLDPAIGQLATSSSSAAESPTAQEQIDLATTIWNKILLFPLFVALLFVVARAVVESRGPAT